MRYWTPEDKDYMAIYREGALAARSGLDRRDNPHWRLPGHNAWIAGYRSGIKGSTKQERPPPILKGIE